MHFKIPVCGTIVMPIFHLATLFARREAKTRFRQRDLLKLAGEKIRREQVGSVPTLFVCSREQSRQVENRLKYIPWAVRLDIQLLCVVKCESLTLIFSTRIPF